MGGFNFKNIVVMFISGIVATIGFNTIPFKAYIIVAALSALVIASIITQIETRKK